VGNVDTTAGRVAIGISGFRARIKTYSGKSGLVVHSASALLGLKKSGWDHDGNSMGL